MATVNFLYRSVKDKADLVLRLLYRYNGKDHVIGIKTKFEVSKNYWNKQHKLKHPKTIAIARKQNEVNNELHKIEHHILTAFNSTNPDVINKAWLQTQMDYYYAPPEQHKNIPTHLIEYIDFYIDYRSHELKKTSVRRFNVIKHKLERFQRFRKRPILIREVNDNFKREFVLYCKMQRYAQNTIQRELVFIKTFCKHARFLGLDIHPQLDSLRLDRAKVEKIYLSFEELEQIEKVDKSKLGKNLENAKDWLIISCYTGQRISDFMRFTDKQIRVENGKSLLEFTQKKTGKNMTVPLHGKVLEILHKRNGKFPASISNQRYNSYIKEVCKIAGLIHETEGSKKIEIEPESGIYRKVTGTFEKWELVTSHIGRRSFATNFYGKIPTTYLIYVTGHSSEAMFLNYIGKSNKDLAMELTNYF
ncbi:MAG: tyrosine-type recombinase/integrase [Bacteroidota bacterium]